MINSSDIYYPSDASERHFINSIWRLQEYNVQERIETILPKGTVEIIFNLSDPITYRNPYTDVQTVLPTCFINGINFKPFELIKNGQQFFLGIQLNAIGLKALFNAPVKEFSNNVVESSLVCSSLGYLYDQLCVKNTFDAQVGAVRNWIHKKTYITKHHKSVNQLHQLFYAQPSNGLTVKDLCHKNCISDRQLRRISAEWLGMNTESFLLYNKYLSALHLLHHSNLSLTQIGIEAGFYDQSHFIRAFRSYTDITPKDYQASVCSFPGHIYT